MLIATILKGENYSFSKEEIKIFLHEDRIRSLVHTAVHGKIKYHRDLAAKQILDMYRRCDESVTIEHVMQVEDYADDPEILKEARELLRDNTQSPQ